MENKLKLFLFIGFFAFVCVPNTFAQKKQNNYKIKGYIKNLQSVTFNTFIDNTVTSNNILHHRLNFKWYLNDEFTVASDLRSQLFVGDQVNALFTQSIGADDGLVDLSFNIIESKVLLNSQIDRLWLGWQKKKWEARIGRQRINWGRNLAFNPNDLFNTYNFLDFDYEERPGTDAIKIIYNPNYNSSFEFAYSPNFNNIKQSVAALKYGFNKWQYDFQVIGGYYKSDIAIGLGWAGNIKNGGFKGELTYFQPTDSISKKNFNFSLTYDNVFGSTYFQAAGLYNLNGISKPGLNSLLSLTALNFSPKNLFPFKYTAILSSSFTINPLTNSTVAIVYAPGVNTLILTPSISYSIVDNWDLNLFVQSFFSEIERFEHLSSSIFLRLKWSY